jgi:NAD+ kinase
MIRTVGLVVNPEKKIALEEVPRLTAWFKARRIKVRSKTQLPKADAIITLGGDGTILSIAPLAARLKIPVLGVNIGHLGFMTSIGLSSMYEALESWLEGHWEVSSRMMLQVKVPKVKEPQLALNDAVIRIGSPTRVTRVFTAINHEQLGYLTGDGIIVSTPTGSTAYSLSAQGPVVHPEMEALIMTPICPHSFTQRPVVFPAENMVELWLQDHRDGNEVQLCLDGQRVFSLKANDRVCVQRSPYKLQLLHDPAIPYFRVLREKLSWGER